MKQQLLENYLKSEKEFKGICRKYFKPFWTGKEDKHPRNILDRESLDKILKAEKKLQSAREKWLDDIKIG